MNQNSSYRINTYKGQKGKRKKILEVFCLFIQLEMLLTYNFNQLHKSVLPLIIFIYTYKNSFY